MREFKPKKRQAAASAIAQQAQAKTDKVIDAIQNKYPAAAAFLGIIQASFGIRLAYKQELLNQFTEYLMDNQQVFDATVLLSPEFQDGLIVAVDNYFTLRTDEKRKLARRIFYDFGKSNEKPVYPLERYDSTLQLISQNGIRLLGFIHVQVPIIMERYVDRHMTTNGNAVDELSRKNMRKVYTANKSLNEWIEEYIFDRERFEVTSRPDGSVWREDIEKFRTKIREQFGPGLSELEQLGLAKSTHVSGVLGGAEDKYNLTDYGKKFTTIIMPELNAEEFPLARDTLQQ